MRQRRTLSLPALTAERLAKAAGVSRSTLFYDWPPSDAERRDAVAREAEHFAEEVKAWATTLRGASAAVGDATSTARQRSSSGTPIVAPAVRKAVSGFTTPRADAPATRPTATAATSTANPEPIKRVPFTKDRQLGKKESAK